MNYTMSGDHNINYEVLRKQIGGTLKFHYTHLSKVIEEILEKELENENGKVILWTTDKMYSDKCNLRNAWVEIKMKMVRLLYKWQIKCILSGMVDVLLLVFMT